MSFSLVDITPEFSREYSCTGLATYGIIVLRRDLVYVYEACQENKGGGAVVKLKKTNETWSKSQVVGSSSYNRAFLAKTRIYTRGIGRIAVLSGYGEAHTGAECGNNGDLWIFYDDETYTHLCSPYSNTGGGNILNALFDIITGKIYTGGHNVGNRIQRWNFNGFEDDWLVESGISEAYIFPVTDDKLLVVTGAQGVNMKLYIVPFDVLRSHWKETSYLVEHESVTALGALSTIWGTRSNYATFNYAYTGGSTEGGGWNTVRIDRLGNVSYFQQPLHFVMYGKYLVYSDEANDRIYIFDEDFNEVDTIDIDLTNYFVSVGIEIDPPYTLYVNRATGAYKVYAFALNGYVPFIEFNPVTNKFRVVDFITGEVITAKVRAIFSKVAGGTMGPIIADPSHYTDLTVSDWTSLPAPPSPPAFINLYVYDIQG